ncbi:hypothetical protein FRC08_017518 [Ceratobasidium sp. 394]|nr:hypothetical protein FRC08_017518 [Ceratobasidium sp. 394]
MSDWLSIAGAITGVATAIDRAYRSRSNETLHGPDAGKLLKEVEELLSYSNTILEDYKDTMDEDEYRVLKGKYHEYRAFQLQMAQESQGPHAIGDQIQLHNGSKESGQNDVRALLASVDKYQVDVLSASRATHP